MVGGRVGVGHDHLGDARAIDDRTFALAVAIADLVQHEAFARGEADAERPVLPLDLPAIDREARAILLHDIERLERRCAYSGSSLAIVVRACFRDRNDVGLIDELDHLVLDQVDERDHAFDRVRIAVVLGIGAPVGHGTDEPTALLDLAIEVSGRERVDLDQLDLAVGEAAALHRTPPAGVGLDDVADLEELLDDHRWLPVGKRPGRVLVPGGNGPGGEVDDGEMGHAGLAIENGGGRASRQRLARLPGEDIAFGRLLELYEAEAGIRAQALFGLQDVAGRRQLGLAQRIEWVPAVS